MSTERHLLFFDNPPVRETVLGVQFDPLRGFQNAHLGAFWKLLGVDWPEASDAPALEPQFEQFDDQARWSRGKVLRISNDVSTRLQIRSRSKERMIQVQNGRFHYNWLRKDTPNTAYPTFANLLPEFRDKLSRFVSFLLEEGVGQLAANQWEVTYVNHIPQGELWQSPSDWGRVLSLVCQPGHSIQVNRADFESCCNPSTKFEGVSSSEVSVTLQSLAGTWHFEIAPKLGRLHIDLKHGKSADGQQLIVLSLTARGPILRKNQDGLSLEEGLALGRAAIDRSFFAITSDLAREHWGYHQ